MSEVDLRGSTAMSVLSLFSTSKDGVEKFAKQIIDSVDSGETNPLKVRVWIRTMEMIIDLLKEGTKDAQMVEADKYEKSFEYAGAKITKMEVGTRYNFKHCGDSVWEMESFKESSAKNARIIREEFLKTLKEPLTIVDDLTGEITTINPPVKTSTSGIKIEIR